MEGIKVTCPVRSVDHNNSGIAAEYLHDKLRLKVNLYSSSTDLTSFRIVWMEKNNKIFAEKAVEVDFLWERIWYLASL